MSKKCICCGHDLTSSYFEIITHNNNGIDVRYICIRTNGNCGLYSIGDYISCDKNEPITIITYRDGENNG